MKEYKSQLEEQLHADGFETFTIRDGMLGVRYLNKQLGTIGSNGEFYCSSQDLLHPFWKAKIEQVMKSIEVVNEQTVGIPDMTTEKPEAEQDMGGIGWQTM